MVNGITFVQHISVVTAKEPAKQQMDGIAMESKATLIIAKEPLIYVNMESIVIARAQISLVQHKCHRFSIMEFKYE